MTLRPTIVDFETEPIQHRPEYPPKPVSFSLKLPEWRSPKFFAWGHKTGGNNCSVDDAKRILTDVWRSASEVTPIVGQNVKFDFDVAEEHFGLPLLPWHVWHDTMFLLFLDDPHQRELGLKPSSERLLGMPPEEQDTVKDWVLSHKKTLEADFPEIVDVYGGIKPSTAASFIAYVPSDIAGRYANGDVLRTHKLFNKLYYDVTVTRRMKTAYDRERKLLPILLRNEREGLRVDVDRMAEDQPKYEAAQDTADAWLRRALKASNLDFDKDAEVAAALEQADAVSQWTQTATGRLSVSKKNLKISHFRNPKIAAAYSYRQRMATTLETFIRPWLRYGASGRMHTTWNQVRQSKGGMGDTGGTRTGRPSTDTPNFLNMPKKVKEGSLAGFIMPTHIPGLPPPPKVRSYILPDSRGHVIGRRDFVQQELRVLAHFTDGLLMQAYLADPTLDVHDLQRQKIEELTGIKVTRDTSKTLTFAFIYGQGKGALAETLGVTMDDVTALRAAQMAAIPDLKDFDKALKLRAAKNEPFRTWGGREYYCEPPMFSEKYKRFMTFEYKMCNVAVQGSSADITKEALIRYDAVKHDSRFMLTVYDEIDIDTPKKALRREMLLLREAMLSIELDVPLLSDAEFGTTLGDLEDLAESRPDLSRWGVQ